MALGRMRSRQFLLIIAVTSVMLLLFSVGVGADVPAARGTSSSEIRPRPARLGNHSAGVILHDVLLADHRLVELFARGQVLEDTGELRLVDLDPRGDRPALRGIQGRLDESDFLALRAHLDLVVVADAVARNVHALTVHENVIVAHELPPLGARDGKAHPVDDVVEPALEEAEHLFARAAAHVARARVVPAELIFEQAVDAARLLLFTETKAVLRKL